MKYKIISGQYELGTEEQQNGYKMLFGENNIQHKFDLYFHWYNVVHELGHCIVEAQKVTMTPVQEEMFVNEFAVAYWRYLGKEAQLEELEHLLQEILAKIPSPVPKDRSFTEYYESIWGTDTLTGVMVYGYLQFYSVLEAIKHGRNFPTVLNSIGIEIGNGAAMDSYDGTICAQNTSFVLHSAVSNMNKFLPSPLQVCVELVENPMVQCAQFLE